MSIFLLSMKSLFNRKTTALLTIFSIAISVMLLLGVERIKNNAKNSFANTISGTDLIVGARSGATQLLLYSIFRIGNATNNVTWKSYRDVATQPKIAWTIPFSLGDSHRGFRVLGTNGDYFKHYRYGNNRLLTFLSGIPFDDLFDTVIGSDVATSLGYQVGSSIVVAHGLGQEGFSKHQDKPFRVTGILRKTGTPVDRTVHVSLRAIEAIHIDWKSGARIPGKTISADDVRKKELRPRAITAFLVGLKSRLAAFSMQRFINKYREEPLLAILPGAALQELWSLMGTAEIALSSISIVVVVSGLLGMLTMLLSSLNERCREMAILRSVGARPTHIFGLFVFEATVLTTVGTLVGLILLCVLLVIAQPIINNQFGVFVSLSLLTIRELTIIGLIIIAGTLVGFFPAYQAYRKSLTDGMMVRN
jgi:putative ABC transport system permease protein